MRCKKDEFIKGNYFHIFNRSVMNDKLFRDDYDYIWVKRRFIKKVVDYPCTIFAYCLMPNHYHFLLRQNSCIPVYKLFNDVFSSYVRHYNHKYKRKGTLFAGSLQHLHIKYKNYLITLCKYIHANPVKAKLVKNLETWVHSNYLEWIGSRNESLFSDELLKEYYLYSKEYETSINEYIISGNNRKFTRYALD